MLVPSAYVGCVRGVWMRCCRSRRGGEQRCARNVGHWVGGSNLSNWIFGSGWHIEYLLNFNLNLRPPPDPPTIQHLYNTGINALPHHRTLSLSLLPPTTITTDYVCTTGGVYLFYTAYKGDSGIRLEKR